MVKNAISLRSGAACALLACLVISVLNGQERRFEGEPVSLKVAGISAVDFFRLMAEFSGLNILIDPEVSGSVTLHVEEVPWDQLMVSVAESLGLVLRVEGNVLRVSTKARLRQDLELERLLRQARMESGAPILTARRLNYASAEQILPIIQQHLSSRGTVDADPRTNTLIITDVQEHKE